MTFEIAILELPVYFDYFSCLETNNIQRILITNNCLKCQDV